MFLVLHRQDFLRSGFLWEEDELGKVRSRDLHFFHVFQVRIAVFLSSSASGGLFADDDPRYLEQMIIPQMTLPHP